MTASTWDESRARGKSARELAPLDSHRVLDPRPDRDAVGLLLEQAETRVPELVPIRYGRMLTSPFAFFRGAALPMAADLAATPSPNLRVQLCGDAHLSNFGAFASPERRLVFDLNDFDETAPGPFEWDVKRLAASIAVAGRQNGFAAADTRACVVAGVAGYRTAMREFAQLSLLEVWYSHLDVESAAAGFTPHLSKEARKKAEKRLAKARTRTSEEVLTKLTSVVDGRHRIVSDPPLVVPIEEIFDDVGVDTLYAGLGELLKKYVPTLQSDRRHLVQQYSLSHVARKVVGVGSVGTRAWILLLEANGGREPLFLQAKEAQESVLERYCGRSRYGNHAQRVVAGQHLMQATSDIFLGWQRTTVGDGLSRDFYVRQLRDWKASARIDEMLPAGMAVYAGLCGWTLARAHARSGDRIALAAYLGKSDTFDRAVADFAETYADLNERDHEALAAAAREGRIEVQTGL